MKALSKIHTVVFSFLKAVISLSMVAIILCNIYLAVGRQLTPNRQPTILGFSFASVLTGSMEPEICVGDIVVTHKENTYKSNDIIMFSAGKNLITHRIIEDTPTGFITKGDCNNVADEEIVSADNIVGKVVYIIPLNRLKRFFFSPCVIPLLLLVSAVVVINSRLNRTAQKNINNRIGGNPGETI